jgi:glycosyltransferase involved in cell wall biosynthesis
MKLLVVSHSCATATNQRIYAELQARPGWDVTLAIPAGWRDEFGNVLDQPSCPGLEGRVWKLPVLGAGKIILHAYRVSWARILRREKFDVIYVSEEPYAVAAAQICLANLRSARPAALGFYSAQNIRKQYPPPFAWTERMLYRRSRFAFPVTEAVAAVLAEKGFRGAAPVCPLPIDPGLYHPDRETAARRDGEVVLGYVGRLVEAKGLRTLAAALGKLGDRAWRLVVIGSGDYEAKFREELRAGGVLERVDFRGFVPHEETPRFLRAMDVVVVPSETQPNWKEQFGRVIPEALACGAAVVGSDSGEIPILIERSGGGLVFPERDAAALAERLRVMIDNADMRRAFSQTGGSWVTATLSVRAVAERMAVTMEEARDAA